MEFYEGHIFISNFVNDDVRGIIMLFEPDSKTYAINRRPEPIIEWNKFALSREICYGCKVREINRHINRYIGDTDKNKNILIWHWNYIR